jgi:hypothetical protein
MELGGNVLELEQLIILVRNVCVKFVQTLVIEEQIQRGIGESDF